MAKMSTPAKHGCAIKPCECSHVYQDAKYGKGKRVHNIGGTQQTTTFSCTACGKTR